jgi:hypothetical protein
MKEWESTAYHLPFEPPAMGDNDPVYPNPQPPKGAGWELKGAITHGKNIVWFWEREDLTY